MLATNRDGSSNRNEKPVKEWEREKEREREREGGRERMRGRGTEGLWKRERGRERMSGRGTEGFWRPLEGHRNYRRVTKAAGGLEEGLCPPPDRNRGFDFTRYRQNNLPLFLLGGERSPFFGPPAASAALSRSLSASLSPSSLSFPISVLPSPSLLSVWA